MQVFGVRFFNSTSCSRSFEIAKIDLTCFRIYARMCVCVCVCARVMDYHSGFTNSCIRTGKDIFQVFFFFFPSLRGYSPLIYSFGSIFITIFSFLLRRLATSSLDLHSP